MSSPFNILQQSPHDLRSPANAEPPPSAIEAPAMTWVPSRYNVRATADDGRLILWNTYSGAISVFQPEQRSLVQALLSGKGIDARPEGVVKYLCDRGFLIKKRADEWRRLRLAVGAQHYRTDALRLILLPTEDCNFRCAYCYESFERGTMLPWVRSAIKEYVNKNVDHLKYLIIAWFGGEPLYGFEAVEDLAPFFYEVAKENSLTYFSDMTTNGYLLTPKVAGKLLSWGIKSYQITLDGPPEDHNRTRPTRNGQESFAKILENLVGLSRRDDDFSVTIRANFSIDNAGHMDRFLDIIGGAIQGDARFKLRFHPVDRWGGANDERLKIFDREAGRQVEQNLVREACERDLAIKDDIRETNQLGARVCGAARPYNFIIGASGKVMKCTLVLDKEDFNVIGKIDREGNLNLDEDKAALWCDPVFEDDQKCRKCIFLPGCQGLKCPLAKIRTGKHACVSTRFNPKGELLTTLHNNRGNGRRATVTGSRVLTAALPGQ